VRFGFETNKRAKKWYQSLEKKRRNKEGIFGFNIKNVLETVTRV